MVDVRLTTFELKINDLKQSLDALSGKLSGAMLGVALEAGGVIQASATIKAPIDIGNLRGRINCWQAHSDDDTTVTVHIGPRDCYSADGAPYPIYIEYGTGIYAEGGNGRKTPWVWLGSDASVKWRGAHYTRGMRPHPFMRSALAESEPECRQIIAEHIDEAIRQ